MQRMAGLRVLRAAGAEFEADLSFAGLNQVLHPLFDEIEGLNPPQRAALEVALGLGDGPAPDQLMVCNAGLSLMVKAGSKEPLLVIVDDLQWVDRASALVLGFVARRLHGTRVGFLAASRSGDESFFERSGLRGHDLGPLDDAASTALLADRFPALAPRVRQRLLAESQGNPLALLELPAALTSIDNSSHALAPHTLPLSERLQAVFASRITGLPAARGTCSCWPSSMAPGISASCSPPPGRWTWRGSVPPSERGWCVSILMGDSPSDTRSHAPR